MGASASANDDETISAINVTPLVDVTLVLLIIMMVTAKIILSQGLTMELPKGSPITATKEDLILSVKVTAEQKMLLNGEEITDLEALAQRARDAHKANPEVKAVVDGDPKAKHGKVVRILDVLKRNGVEKIAFTRHKEPGALPAPQP